MPSEFVLGLEDNKLFCSKPCVIVMDLCYFKKAMKRKKEEKMMLTR